MKPSIKKILLSAVIVAGITSINTGCNSGTGKTSNTDSTKTVASSDDNTLLGAGSTFVYPLFSKQFSEYNKINGLKINYQSIGSGGGILQLTNKTVDFGASDAPLNEEQTTKIGAAVLHVPMAAGADVVSYNLPQVTDTLELTPEVIANIFLGKITKWNDAAISKINAGVKLPEVAIVVAHRSDGSGTSYIWTDYLSKVSEEWKTKVGKGTSVNWPVGLGGKGNEGVAGLVKQTPGSIGYIELSYAFQNKMAVAKIQNKSGNFILPTLASITAAGNVPLPADGKVSITNTDAPDGYPISSFTWALLYKEQNYNNRSNDKAQKLIKLLYWNTHEGQQYCTPLLYAPLAPAAITVVEALLKSATFDGKPLMK